MSTGSDLTLVLRVRGGLYVPGVDHLTLRYPDGRTVRIEPHGNRFDYAVPKERQDDLMTPGTITAYDAHGSVLAERPVARRGVLALAAVGSPGWARHCLSSSTSPANRLPRSRTSCAHAGST